MGCNKGSYQLGLIMVRAEEPINGIFFRGFLKRADEKLLDMPHVIYINLWNLSMGMVQ